jgi:hypothetical protein
VVHIALTFPTTVSCSLLDSCQAGGKNQFSF